MKIGKIIILGGLVYILFFNDRSAELAINDASNKQIASIGINANANAERNRSVALTAFTGFFLDSRQHLVYINTEKGLIIYNGELKAFSFRVVKREGRFIEVDYGPRFSHDYWELTANGITLIDVDDNTKVFLKRLKNPQT
jgi:predicted Zn-dependent protease